MIVIIAADTGQIEDRLDPHFPQMRARPMPDSNSSCGDWIAPAHSTTSARAPIVRPSASATPVARPFSISTRVT